MKIFCLILLLTSIHSFAQVYNDGFKVGYKAGYCYNQSAGCVAPPSPVPPVPKPGKNSYQDGYNDGFNQGQADSQNKNSSNNNSLKNVPYTQRSNVNYGQQTGQIAEQINQIGNDRQAIIERDRALTSECKLNINKTFFTSSVPRINLAITGLRNGAINQVDIFYNSLYERRLLSNNYGTVLQMLYNNYFFLISDLNNLNTQIENKLSSLDVEKQKEFSEKIQTETANVFNNLQTYYIHDVEGKKNNIALTGHRYKFVYKGSEISQSELIRILTETIQTSSQNLKSSTPAPSFNNTNCDLIFLTDGQKIEAKVEEIRPTEIVYTKCNYMSSPKYVIEKKTVKQIIYPDGSSDDFN